ncbi:MAG: response regulator [Desulfuromonadaceae bacterium]
MEEPTTNNAEATRYGILFVDDEPHILSALKRLVVDEEVDIFTASSGAEGLKVLAREENIGLIVSDQRMPEMNGAEFLARAKELNKDAQRIILTGYADIEATIAAINKGGAHRYLSKPWNDAELLEVVRENLRFYGLYRENQRLSEIVREQNQTLQNWNSQLKTKVLQQTATIREKNEQLQQHLQRLKQNFRGTLTAFTSLLELRDRNVRNHSKNVTQIAADIARSLMLPAKQIDLIQVAAMLHDIGKIGTPDTIMGTPEAFMNAEELTEYRRHSIRGQAAIDAIEELRPAGVLIRHHHEYFDGSGYPDQLAGEAIPLGARILAVADFIDLQMQKPNRALGLAKKYMETRFDPGLLPHLEKPVRNCYEQFFATTGLQEQTVTISGLREGMVLAKDLLSGTGLLLLSKGSALTFRSIEHIRRNHELDPMSEEIVVLVRQ